MKKMMMLLVSMVLASTASASLFQVKGKYNEDKTNVQVILDAYAKALSAAKENGVQIAVKAAQYEMADFGTIGQPEASNILLLESGKGSASEYGTENLLCIPASIQGTGLIVNCGLYLKVFVSNNVATEKTIVTFDSVVEITAKK